MATSLIFWIGLQGSMQQALAIVRNLQVVDETTWKRSSIVAVSKKGALKLGAIAAELARGEGLTAHAKAAEYRMK